MSIVLTNLNKRFGQVLVVNNVSLTLPEGELFVLLGGSGSGKSTILRMVAGLTEVDSGRIELNGRDVTLLPPQKRGTGFVFQNYSIFRHMTVTENIEFGLRIRSISKAERKQRSEELLDLVGLTGLGERYPSQLSGGQQQRVALARALAYRPEVLLLDEPFGALDVKIRAQLRESLKEIQRQLGVTTMLVTHDQEEAFELADRIGLVDRGSLIEVGTPEQLYHHPKTEFAAIFIGGGNVLVGRRDENEIRLGATSLPFPKDALTHDPGAPVRVLFRPETVILQNSRFSKQSGVHPLGQGRIVGQVFTGAAQRLRLEVEGLQGVRPIVPPPAYGQRATQIEVLVPSNGDRDIDLSAVLEVGIKDYHVLAPTGLKLLLCCDDSPAGEAVAAFGLRLAEAARGPVTLLAVSPSVDDVTERRQRLETVAQRLNGSQNPRLTLQVRQGTSSVEILQEAQEGYYEMVVLGRHDEPGARPAGLGTTGQRVLSQAQIPIMLVKSPREQIRRILICTAAGEPGKSDVRFGGRLARRTRAEAAVLHVRREDSSPRERARADKHLSQAQASLGALGVKSAIKIAEGSALQHILDEAEAGDYDLLVIGAPAPRTNQQMIWTDLATQIIALTSRPVVVVPMLK